MYCCRDINSLPKFSRGCLSDSFIPNLVNNDHWQISGTLFIFPFLLNMYITLLPFSIHSLHIRRTTRMLTGLFLKTEVALNGINSSRILCGCWCEKLDCFSPIEKENLTGLLIASSKLKSKHFATCS